MPTITHKAKGSDGQMHDVYEITSRIPAGNYDDPNAHVSGLATWCLRGGKPLNKSGDTLTTPDGALTLTLVR